MSTKSFRFDWYPKDAHTDFMLLSPEEVGVLMQICNLIYLHHGPIDNDGKWIARNFDDFSTAKCNRVIRQLLQKGHIYLTEGGDISKSMCERQLEVVEERREHYASSGDKNKKKSSKASQKPFQNLSSAQAKNEQNQQHVSGIEAAPASVDRKASLVIEEIPLLSPDVLEQFFGHRKALGKPIHQNFIPNIIQDLKNLSDNGEDPNLVVEQSIKNGWTSLRSVENLKEKKNGKRKSNYGEQAKELLAELRTGGADQNTDNCL